MDMDMCRVREPFDELRAIVHRRALDRRAELLAIAGAAAGTMRLLALVIDVLESAIADARRHHGDQHGY